MNLVGGNAIYGKGIHCVCIASGHSHEYMDFRGVGYKNRVKSSEMQNTRMIKKGNRAADVANYNMIETLIVWSEDLVQVVAKEVPTPSIGVSECVRRVGLVDIASINECLEKKAKANETNGDNKHGSETRHHIQHNILYLLSWQDVDVDYEVSIAKKIYSHQQNGAVDYCWNDSQPLVAS